ncbi:MAG: deoxynucleoside kinase [Rhodocyclaceae bacterium]|nr:deoxynucleoside kinase [Rhodocyclaceae bacterium]
MLEKARYIVVEGPIGAGKTSLAQRLAAYLNAPAVLEMPAENPFLARFYQDMERHALPLQLHFLFQRVDLLAALPQGRVVSDFLFEKDALFAELTLSEHELALYRRVYALAAPAAAVPDLVVYLQARPDTLSERVRRRGLAAERRISEAYLARVAERYARFFHQFDACPLFIVDAEELNPVDNDEDFALLVQRLTAMRSFREFFGYAQ